MASYTIEKKIKEFAGTLKSEIGIGYKHKTTLYHYLDEDVLDFCKSEGFELSEVVEFIETLFDGLEIELEEGFEYMKFL